MNPLSVAVLFVAVAAASAGGLLGAGLVADKGAIEGALGGQWIPDVPVAGHGAGIIGPGVVAGGPSARGALEGALGGQWIPDVPVGHGVPGVLGAPGLVAPGVLGGPLGLGLGLGLGPVGPLGLGLGLGHGLAGSRGALEGALGGQWIPDTHGH
ncbi:uncharacterized protein [Diabrotica undecimpunctata]|uniref:uncharacterized protein n=1 Tax=Diabrotica undecimpunctata TaxID=50387 RepID=UPI003B639C58